MFSRKDSRKLPYEGHLSSEGPVMNRSCDACGEPGTDLVPIVPEYPVPVVPGRVEIPPFVCRDFRACVRRFTAAPRV